MAEFEYKDFREHRDAMLRTIAYGYAQRGITAEIKPGSEQYIRAEAYARRISIAISNGTLANTARDPLNAQGDDLLALASVFGVNPRLAGKAIGYVTIGVATGQTVSIPAEYKATGPNGLKYQTTIINLTKSNGDQIEMQASLAGTGANIDPGVKLTWDNASVGFLAKIATVSPGGIDGGTDDDTVEVVRQRLIDRLSFPQGGGNWSQIKAWAEESSSAVSVAFVYQAVRGPSSYDVAIVGNTGDGELAASFRSTAKSYILSQMPGHANLNVTTINNELIDVVVSASLPLPKIVGGAGGGWRDGTPYPAEDVKVTAYVNDVATVNGSAAPSVGNHIGIWDPDSEKMNEYVIVTVSGTGPWDITVQGGFGFDPTGAYLSTGAVRLASYADSLNTSMLNLGPGEKTNDPIILPFGLRKPSADVSYPQDASFVLLSRAFSVYPEILNYDYALRVDTGTSTPRTSPSLTTTTADPPRRLKIKHLAIRKT